MPTAADIATPGPARTQIAPTELADLISSFSEVTSRLEATHDHLRAEVARLTRELGQANEQLERSRRLAALGEMAAGIAHEVRNPLGSIRLYARLLDQDLADRPAERTTVGKISAAARALDGIVGDVLTFAREFKVRTQPTPAAELLDRAAEACMHDGVPGFGTAELVRADLARCPEECPMVEADPGLAVQALVNVVRNAFEAADEAARAGCPGPHRVTLDASLRPGEDGAGPIAVIEVRDTGPGVNDELVRRMFNPFFTTRSTGTGLGLPIVHRIVEAHGGHVAVRNNGTPGRGAPDADARGATFELQFPAWRDPGTRERPQDLRAPVAVTGSVRQTLEQIR